MLKWGIGHNSSKYCTIKVNFEKTVKPEITKYIEIEDLVRSYPESIKFLAERQIKCIACGEPVWGSLEEAAREKGYSDREIDSIISELISFLIEK